MDGREEDQALPIPGPKEYRNSQSEYVHAVAWLDDWADQLSRSVITAGVEPTQTLYVLVCVSAALPEHQRELLQMLKLIDSMSNTSVQFLPAGLEGSGAHINISDSHATACLRDVGMALSLRSIPPGVLAIMTCRSENESYVFDIDGAYLLRPEKLTAVEFRQVLFDLSALRPGSNKKVPVRAAKQVMTRHLVAHSFTQMSPWITVFLEKLSSALKG